MIMQFTVAVVLMILTGPCKIEGDCSIKLDNEVIKSLLVTSLKNKEPSSNGCNRDRVAFTASLSKDDKVGPKETVVFDKVWTNVGNGYDNNTGIFKVPRSGTYQISGTVKSHHNKYVHLSIWKNDEKTVGLYAGRGHVSGTTNIVLELRKDDKVCIKHHDRGEETVLGNQNHWSVFSGFLIN